MLKNIKLSRQLTIVFFFFGSIILAMGLFSIHINRQMENRLAKLDREDIPLALAISEATRQQLEQVLHINETFLFGEVGDRGKFEVANEAFASAGRRLTNVLVEARYLAQKGLENSPLDAEKRQLEQVKTIISDFQKIHADFEHLAGNTIRSIYKYRFLTKAGIITGNGNQTLAEAEEEYLKILSSNTSSLDDETKRLENKLKQAFDTTKELSRHLTREAHQARYVTWVSFVLFMTLFVVGGLFLLMAIHTAHQSRLRHQADNVRKLAEPFRKKADFLLHSAQQIGSTFLHITSNDDSRQDSMRALSSALTILEGLTTQTQQMTSEAGTLSKETETKAKNTDLFISRFKEISNHSVDLCEQIQKNMQGLIHHTMQVNLLATSASAEASRQEASRGFAIFTDEIKGLSQSIIQIIDSVGRLLETAHKEIKNGRDDVKYATENFLFITDGTTRLTELSHGVKTAAQKQADLIGDLQGELSMLRDMATANYHMIQQSSIANHTLSEQTESIAALIQSLMVLLLADERRSEYRKHLLPETDRTSAEPAPKKNKPEDKNIKEEEEGQSTSGESAS